MPDVDGARDTKNYHTDVPQSTEGFYLKGSNSYDWGMKNRLARIFNAESGNTVMLAFDHGYFQGPTTGLERIDVNINPLIPYADTLMLTRGILRTMIPLQPPRHWYCGHQVDRAFSKSSPMKRLPWIWKMRYVSMPVGWRFKCLSGANLKSSPSSI